MAIDETEVCDKIRLLTIGYGNNRSFEDFVELLQHFGVRYLADVRTKPFSKYRPEFSRNSLEASLRGSALTYLYMGDTLGGLPIDETCYTDGKVDYSKVRERDWFIAGLQRLKRGWQGGHRIALMCAELEPHRCHRSKLIGEALQDLGIPIEHIDENGLAISQSDIMVRVNGNQPLLFDIGYTSGVFRLIKPSRFG